MANEAWSLVSERIRRFEQGRLPLSQFVQELQAIESALDPPRDSWKDTFHLALTELARRLEVWQKVKVWGSMASPEPDYADLAVRDLVQTMARLVRHPDDA